MSGEEPDKNEHRIREVLILTTCPKCGKKYIASFGHECTKEH